MIRKQLNQLCILKNCFLYEGRVFERLYNHESKLKFRFMISEDDYDYVEKESEVRELTRVFNNLKRK